MLSCTPKPLNLKAIWTLLGSDQAAELGFKATKSPQFSALNPHSKPEALAPSHWALGCTEFPYRTLPIQYRIRQRFLILEPFKPIYTWVTDRLDPKVAKRLSTEPCNPRHMVEVLSVRAGLNCLNPETPTAQDLKCLHPKFPAGVQA